MGKKNGYIRFDIETDYKELLKKRAVQAGLSLSAYLRQIVLNTTFLEKMSNQLDRIEKILSQ